MPLTSISALSRSPMDGVGGGGVLVEVGSQPPDQVHLDGALRSEADVPLTGN